MRRRDNLVVALLLPRVPKRCYFSCQNEKSPHKYESLDSRGFAHLARVSMTSAVRFVAALLGRAYKDNQRQVLVPGASSKTGLAERASTMERGAY